VTWARRFVVACVVLVVLAAGFVAFQLTRSEPRPSIAARSIASSSVLPGRIGGLPWPSSGQAAVAITGIGVLGSTPRPAPVPIASLAKVMTALVVLRDHPLRAGQSGPAVPITAADQAVFEADQAAGDSVAPMIAGESLTELQLLEALLIPSADNVALVLAQWDSGSMPGFVTKMNSTASALGMRSTRYADADGLSSGTVSTAADQLLLAEAVAANPVVMAVVRQPELSLPNSPLLYSYNTALGHQGVVGIKTGSTAAAGGCFMFAVDGTAAGHRVEVLGVVVGIRGTPFIAAALNASLALVRPALASLRQVTVLPAHTVVGEVSSDWGERVTVVTTRPVTVLGFAGSPARIAVTITRAVLPSTVPTGTAVATVTVSEGGKLQRVSAVTAGPITGPSIRWRLKRL
jgi:D-alanyl-D-alanine carboxypeptidase (penicillin-binding protein 5/6)